MNGWRPWANPHDRIVVDVRGGTTEWAKINDWLDDQGFESGDLEVSPIAQESGLLGRPRPNGYSLETVGHSYRFKRADRDRALLFKLTFGGEA